MSSTGLTQQSPDEGQSRRVEAGKKREEPRPIEQPAPEEARPRREEDG